eukprot:g8318.t1
MRTIFSSKDGSEDSCFKPCAGFEGRELNEWWIVRDRGSTRRVHKEPWDHKLEKNLRMHLVRLVELCRKAKHTLLTDADSNLDCAVDIFRNSIFEKKDVRTIRVLKPFMQWTLILMPKDATYKQMYADLNDGKRVVAFFASKKMLRGCAEHLETVMDKHLIAAYYADSENKDDLFDVNRFWGKYRFIGYTSTVTVSLDFTEEVYRVYAFPNRFSSSPMQVLQAIAEREQYSAFKEELTADGRVHSPTLYTKLWAIDRAEQALKLRAWYPHFMWMVKKKGYKIEYADVDEEEPEEGASDVVREVAAAGEAIAAGEVREMDGIDATELYAEWEEVMNKKKSRVMLDRLEGLALRKYQVQKHFTAPLSGDDILFFEKHRKAVVYRILKEKATPAQLHAKHMKKVEIARECDMEFVVSQDCNIVMALNDLAVKVGFKEGGLEDRTTEVCLKEVNMKSGDVELAIDKMRELGAGVSKSKTLSGLMSTLAVEHKKAIMYRIIEKDATPSELFDKHKEGFERARRCGIEDTVPQDFNVRTALLKLLADVGYGGFDDYTTELCLKEVGELPNVKRAETGAGSEPGGTGAGGEPGGTGAGSEPGGARAGSSGAGGSAAGADPQTMDIRQYISIKRMAPSP